MPSRRIVITGIGVITPIGLDLPSYWDSLRARRSGVRRITSFDPSAFATQIGGAIQGFDPRRYMDKKERKRLNVMPRSVQLAVAAAQCALDDSRIDKQALDPARFSVVLGAGTVHSELIDLAPAGKVCLANKPGKIDLEKWGEAGLPLIPPMWMLNHVPNMAACHISILHNAQGPNNSITQTDVASLLAVGEACRLIKSNKVDVVLTGGGDGKLIPVPFARHAMYAQLSRRNDQPEKACRPFDRQRDGEVVGEGAGILVLEDLVHARCRDARIYAEVIGFGCAFDRGRTGKGLVRAIRIALEQAGIVARDIGHVNAHGYSTQESDAVEAWALREVFGTGVPSVPVFAAKSYFGNLGAAAGVTELAASLLALHHRLVPATLNYEQPDLQCPINVTREPVKTTSPIVLKIGFTELGQCAALVCRKTD